MWKAHVVDLGKLFKIWRVVKQLIKNLTTWKNFIQNQALYKNFFIQNHAF